MAAKSDLPGFYEKRKILFSEKTSEQKMRDTGKQFMEAEQYDDALDFFERCEAEELVRRIASRAVEAGNTPLYMRAKRVLEEEISEEEWNALAERAEEEGAYSMAYVAHLKAGHEERAARLREKMPGSELEGAPAPEAEEETSSS